MGWHQKPQKHLDSSLPVSFGFAILSFLQQDFYFPSSRCCRSHQMLPDDLSFHCGFLSLVFCPLSRCFFLSISSPFCIILHIVIIICLSFSRPPLHLNLRHVPALRDAQSNLQDIPVEEDAVCQGDVEIHHRSDPLFWLLLPKFSQPEIFPQELFFLSPLVCICESLLHRHGLAIDWQFSLLSCSVC